MKGQVWFTHDIIKNNDQIKDCRHYERYLAEEHQQNRIKSYIPLIKTMTFSKPIQYNACAKCIKNLKQCKAVRNSN